MSNKELKTLVVGLALAAFVLWGIGFAYVQPMPPTYVRQMPNGSFIAQTPGQLPTYINRLPNGSYIQSQPGQPPTYINRLPNNAYIIQPPPWSHSRTVGNGDGS